MRPIKQAVANAMGFAAGVLDTSRDLRLEEIDSGQIEGAPVWLVTLSLERHKRTASGMDYLHLANAITRLLPSTKIREKCSR